MGGITYMEYDYDELMRSAIMLHHYCSEHNLDECKSCPFNRGYGRLDGCKLKDIPECWGELGDYDKVRQGYSDFN